MLQEEGLWLLNDQAMGCGCGNCKSIQQQVIQGEPGADGLSAYQLWLQAGHTGTAEDFLASLQGDDGRSAYAIALDNGFTGSEEDWLASLVGHSAYQVWLDAGNTGTVGDFLDSLQGDDGVNAFTFVAPGISGFTMPAVGSTFDLAVVNASWVTMGQPLHVENGGAFLVANVAGNTVTLRNPGPADGYPPTGVQGNASPGSTVTGGVVLKVSATGRPGLHGPPGPVTPGDAGPSAYDVAVQNGFPGNEEQWLNSLIGPPGTKVLFLTGNPNMEASGYGSPDGTLAVETGTPGRTKWWRRTGPGTWVLEYEQVFSTPSDESDLFRVAKSAPQAIPLGTVGPVIVSFGDWTMPGFNSGAWNGTAYEATPVPPHHQRFTLENIILRRVPMGSPTTFTVAIVKNGTPQATTTLTVGSGDTSASIALLMADMTISNGDTVWVEVTPSAATVYEWSVDTGAWFRNEQL